MSPHPPVFCATCRWLRLDRQHPRVLDLARCTHPGATYTLRTPFQEETREHTPTERNGDNQCGDYAATPPLSSTHIVARLVVLLGLLLGLLTIVSPQWFSLWGW